MPETKRKPAATIGGTEIDPDDAPVVRIAQTIVTVAIEQKAEAFVIEPSADGKGFDVTLEKPGGVTESLFRAPAIVYAPLVSRFKIFADLDLAKKDESQQGVIHARYEGVAYDLTLSTEPTEHGEKIRATLAPQKPSAQPKGIWDLADPEVVALFPLDEGETLTDQVHVPSHERRYLKTSAGRIFYRERHGEIGTANATWEDLEAQSLEDHAKL